jgi:hypothetical protein
VGPTQPHIQTYRKLPIWGPTNRSVKLVTNRRLSELNGCQATKMRQMEINTNHIRLDTRRILRRQPDTPGIRYNAETWRSTGIDPELFIQTPQLACPKQAGEMFNYVPHSRSPPSSLYKVPVSLTARVRKEVHGLSFDLRPFNIIS